MRRNGPTSTRGWEDQGQRRGKGPRGSVRSDEWIHDAVYDRLSEGYIEASDVGITVENGEVTLTGTVPDKHSRRWAEDLVEELPGVIRVDNRLKIRRRD